MKLDPAIVEAAARALARQRLDFNSRHREPLTPDRYKASEDAGWPNFVPEANIALAAAIPLIEAAYVKSRATIHVAAIRNAALEEAAKVVEGEPFCSTSEWLNDQIAAAIRALKSAPEAVEER